MLPKNLIEWKVTQMELPDYDGVYYALDDDKNGTVAALYTREKGFINPPIVWGQAVSPTWSMFETLKSSPTLGIADADPVKSLTSNIAQVVILGGYAKKGGRKSAVAKFICTKNGDIIVDWLRPEALKDECALEEARQLYARLTNGTDPESRKFDTPQTPVATAPINVQQRFNPYASASAARKNEPAAEEKAKPEHLIPAHPAENHMDVLDDVIKPGSSPVLNITDDDLPF